MSWYIRRTTMQGRRMLAYVGLAANVAGILWLLFYLLLGGQPPARAVHIGDLYAVEGTTMTVQNGALVLGSGELMVTAPIVQSVNFVLLVVFFVVTLLASITLLRSTS